MVKQVTYRQPSSRGLRGGGVQKGGKDFFDVLVWLRNREPRGLKRGGYLCLAVWGRFGSVGIIVDDYKINVNLFQRPTFHFNRFLRNSFAWFGYGLTSYALTPLQL